jgi:CelD/BcsL family acetyltransferase involved in cellulose biosynthesis
MSHAVTGQDFDRARPVRIEREASACLAVAVACSLAEIEALGPEWLELEQTAGPGLDWFQTFAWCRTWVALNTGEGHSTTPHVLALRDGGRLVAIWPLMVVRRAGGLSIVKTLGEPHSQYSGLLLDPTCWSVAHAAALRDAVLLAPVADAIVISLVPQCSLLNEVFPKSAVHPALGNASFIIDLAGLGSREAYFSRLSKTQKRNRGRRLKLLEKKGPVEFEIIWPQDERFAGLVDRCLAFKRRWLEEMQLAAPGFSRLERGGFLDMLPGHGDRAEGACLSVLSVGGRPVAIELGFVRHRHYYAYMGAFDWDERDASPGKVQMDMTIGWLIDHGVETYDLLANQASYKESWSDRQMRLSCYAVARNWRGRLYLRLWLAWLRPIVKRGAGRFVALRQRQRRLLAPRSPSR